MYSEAHVLANCMHNSEDVLRDVFFPMFKDEFDEVVGVPKQSGYQTPTHCIKGITFEEWKLLRYKEFRKANYPSIQEQFDMQYHDKEEGTTLWHDAIQAVKDKYPKP